MLSVSFPLPPPPAPVPPVSIFPFYEGGGGLDTRSDPGDANRYRRRSSTGGTTKRRDRMRHGIVSVKKKKSNNLRAEKTKTDPVITTIKNYDHARGGLD